MRRTYFAILGVFISLLPLVSGCRFFSPPKYDIDKDSLFFSAMPPRTENGANIVAFEFDGESYVFPKEGMRQSFFTRLPWTSKISVRKEKDTIERVFIWHADRDNKKYNPSTSYIHIYLSEENLHQETFKGKGKLRLGAWHSEGEGITFEITTHIPSRGLICGRFSGVLKGGGGVGTDAPKKVENGFFDLKYTF
ncbi:hypothetical protein [Porphyromonas endodontalis]|uniref:hypothetical protein n=1 Tax=Porphyromonas endodontalis TaxID=28124 RepID=UPI0028803B61|nr:hypothetical protein [Porphyromonas endodontalis]